MIQYIKAKRTMPKNLLSNKYLYFKKQGTALFIRTPFSATKDLVQYPVSDLSAGDAYHNALFGPSYNYLIDNSTPYTNSQSWLGSNFHATDDDICPLNYNTNFMGGNHGANICHNLTVASHDKTSADLGSSWTDAGGKTWFLVRIVDATHLWIITDFTNNPTNGYWINNDSIGASPLTHAAGATHTANIIFTASPSVQFTPSVKNITLKILLDGMIVPTDNTVYQCAFLDIVQEYDICDPRTVLAYMKANIGKTIPQAIADVSITADVHMNVRYRYHPNGSCVIYHEINTVNYLSQMYFSGIQSNGLSYSGLKLLQYIPRVKPIVGSVKTWDFTIPQEIQGSFETIGVYTTSWKDSQKPPFRFTQLIKDSSNNPIIGFTLGYSLSKLGTIDSTRKSVPSACSINGSTRKQYPYILNTFNANAGVTYNAICYRGYFDPNSINGATVYQYHEEGNELIVDIDYHINVAEVHLPIPAGWNGKTITILHSDGNITFGTNVIDGDGIIVTVTGGYGSATIKIS